MNQPRTNYSSYVLGLMLTCSVFVASCTTDMRDLESYIAEVKARPAQPIPPIPAVKTYSPYVYQGLTGRDPFRPSTSEGIDEQVAAGTGAGPRPDLNRPKEYLDQRVPQLKNLNERTSLKNIF